MQILYFQVQLDMFFLKDTQMHFIDVIYCDFSLIARATQVLGSWMVQMAVLGKNYQRDTVVDQEQLYQVWMPHGI